MAAGNETMFHASRLKLGKKLWDFTADTLKMALCTSTQVINAGFLGASGDCRYADLTNEVAAGGGYSTGGVTLTSVAWHWYVASATIAAGGTGGTNGAQTVTGTTGTGTKFQAAVTVAGNAITAVNSISLAGDYTVLPTTSITEPVTGASLTGAQLNIIMGAFLTSAQAQWTSATFVAKYAVIYDFTATNKDLLSFVDLETTVGAGLTLVNGILTVAPPAPGWFTVT